MGAFAGWQSNKLDPAVAATIQTSPGKGKESKWLPSPPIASNDGPIQGNARFRTVPGDELLHSKFIVSPGTRRTETFEDSGFRVIEIRKPQDYLAVWWLTFLVAHTNGLHAVDGTS